MDWLERLNRGVGRVSLGRGTAEVLHWAYARHLADNQPHRHTFFEACLVGEYGAGRFVVQGKPHDLKPGDLFVARPGVIHQIVNTGRPEMELRWVSFGLMPAPRAPSGTQEAGEVDGLMRAFAESPRLVVPDARGRLSALWRALQAAADGPPGRACGAQYGALASALLLTIAQAGAAPPDAGKEEPPGPGAGDGAARLAVRFIHDNLARPLPLADVAAQAHLSPRHLARVFQAFTGSPPARYITRARMDRALGLLRQSAPPVPIKEIAAAVGYPDVHHFTRAFAAHFGHPPGVLRQHPEECPVPNVQKPGDLV